MATCHRGLHRGDIRFFLDFAPQGDPQVQWNDVGVQGTAADGEGEDAVLDNVVLLCTSQTLFADKAGASEVTTDDREPSFQQGPLRHLLASTPKCAAPDERDKRHLSWSSKTLLGCSFAQLE